MNDLTIPALNLGSLNPSANKSNKSLIPCSISGLGGINLSMILSSGFFCDSILYNLAYSWKHATIRDPLSFLLCAFSGPLTTKSSTWSTPVMFGGKQATLTSKLSITLSTVSVLWQPQLSNHIKSFPNFSINGLTTVSNHIIIRTVSFQALNWLVMTWPVLGCIIYQHLCVAWIPAIVSSLVHSTKFQPWSTPNPVFLLNMFFITNIPDWSGFSNELTECLIIMKSGAKSPDANTATTAVIRSFILGTPMFWARFWSGGQYRNSGPIA